MVAQMDTSLESHGLILCDLAQPRQFEVVADLRRRETSHLAMITTYLIDKEGVVREVFPSLNNEPLDWHAVLDRLDDLRAERDENAETGQPQRGH